MTTKTPEASMVAAHNHMRAILHELRELERSGDKATLAAIGTDLNALVDQARNMYRSLQGPQLPQTPRSGLDTGDSRGDVGLCRGCGIESDNAYCAQCQAERTEQAPGQGFENPVDGYYTVSFPDGDYRTLKLSTQDADASFAPGKQVAYYLNGPDNWQNYKGFAFVEAGQARYWRSAPKGGKTIAALAILLSGKEAMVNGLKGYAQQSGKCGVCGRMLTTPESIAAGIGPKCLERLGL